MRLSIELKTAQKMTASMRQALFILQMPAIELALFLKAQIEQNPVLEYQETKGEALRTPCYGEMDFEKQGFEVLDELDETFTGAVFPEHARREKQIEASAPPISLCTHLMQQAKEAFSSPEALEAAENIIGNLDERGFLQGAPADPQILQVIQTFDPPGIAARTLQESLLIQLRLKGKNIAISIVAHHFDDLLHNRLKELSKKLNLSIGKLQEVLREEVASLDFSPGSRFSTDISPPIFPDVTVEKVDDSWRIVINDAFFPRFKIAPPPFAAFQKEERSFIRSHIHAGKWLLRALRKRHETLRKIVLYLLKIQAEFFSGHPEKLVPITLRDAALFLRVHESTVARALSNKYLSCPQGIFSLKSFFTPSLSTSGEKISTQTVRSLIAALIAAEDKSAPLSDDALANALAKQGISCARRTVTKYRKTLRIGTAALRKQWY